MSGPRAPDPPQLPPVAEARPAEVLAPVAARPASATLVPVPPPAPAQAAAPPAPAEIPPPKAAAVVPRVPAAEPAPRPTAPPASAEPAAPTGEAPSRPAPIGLGLARPIIRLDGPRERRTDQAVETVSGLLTGSPAERVVLHVNDTAREVSVTGPAFELVVRLAPGPNRVRAVAMGARGVETEDSITMEYVPKPAGPGIAVTAPADGFRLAPDDPPVVAVEGVIDDSTLPRVVVMANGRSYPTAVREGRFRAQVPVLEATVRLWAEAPKAAGESLRSGAVTVHAAEAPTPTGLLVMNWPPGTRREQVDLVAFWRGNPSRADGGAQEVMLRAAGEEASPAGVFYFRKPQPGVYTLVLRYRALEATGAPIRPTLYLPGPAGTPSPRQLRPVTAAGTGRAVLGRVLMPHGILWEQDDWFTGRSESAETITKFRVPEGITWTERKSDLR